MYLDTTPVEFVANLPFHVSWRKGFNWQVINQRAKRRTKTTLCHNILRAWRIALPWWFMLIVYFFLIFLCFSDTPTQYFPESIIVFMIQSITRLWYIESSADTAVNRVLLHVHTHQTNKCLVNLEFDLSPEKGSKYCLTWKVSTPLSNLLCFNDTRLQEPLLSGTQDTRSYFQTPRAPALVHVLFMSGLDISAVCPSGEVTGWKYRVSSKYIHRRTLSNSVCLTLVVTS